MAKLVTTKEKYGVSVAARIEPEIAQKIAQRAERLEISMAKMVGMLIMKGFNPQEPVQNSNQEEIDELNEEIIELNLDVSNLQGELDSAKSLYQTTAARFINEISIDEEEQVEYAQVYNEILNKVKEESWNM